MILHCTSHAGRKQYKRAMVLLLLGLTAPTHVVNAITVTIYKKYTLLSLLLHGAHLCEWYPHIRHTGEVPPLPKYTSSQVTRGVRSEVGEPYTKLAAAFVNKGPGDVVSLVQQHQAVYVAVRVLSLRV